MGFDLYGLNPQNPNKAVRPTQIDWSKKPTEKERNDYFKSVDDYETKVVGSYFRANVWYWRPIWQYVTQLCDDILTEKDMERGEYNDGHKISKTKAKCIASRLKKLDRDGDTMEYELLYKQNMNSLPKEDCSICEGTGMRNDDLGKKTRKENPEYTCNGCEGKGKRDNFNTHYPFESEIIMQFADFCEQSGGFEIC